MLQEEAIMVSVLGSYCRCICYCIGKNYI